MESALGLFVKVDVSDHREVRARGCKQASLDMENRVREPNPHVETRVLGGQIANLMGPGPALRSPLRRLVASLARRASKFGQSRSTGIS